MKIALCCRVYPTHRAGGMPFVCQDRFRELKRDGHEVVVLTTGKNKDPDYDGPHRSSEDEEGVHHLTCPSEVYSYLFAEECEKFCREFEPDIIHLDSFDNQATWWTDFHKSRVAITLHGFTWGAMLTKWNIHRKLGAMPPSFDAGKMTFEIDNLKKADAVIAVSQHEQYMLKEFYGISAKYVPNPIPSYFFDASKVYEGKGEHYLCAYVSGSTERGYLLASNACARADVPLKRIMEVSRDKMPHELDQARALLLPTYYSQGYDLTVAEAFARGIPVIASDIGSYARIPQITKFEMGNEDELVVRIKQNEATIKSNHNADLAQDSLKYAASVHTPEAHVKNWLVAAWN